MGKQQRRRCFLTIGAKRASVKFLYIYNVIFKLSKKDTFILKNYHVWYLLSPNFSNGVYFIRWHQSLKINLLKELQSMTNTKIVIYQYHKYTMLLTSQVLLVHWRGTGPRKFD